MAHVLVVDDHASIRTLVVLALESRGHTCEESGDGAEAGQKIGSDRFDVIVLDLMMPGVDGIEVLNGMKEMNPRPAVLVLTARPGAEQLALGAGATLVINKPFDPDEVADAVDKLAR